MYKSRLNPFSTINSNLYFGSSLSKEKNYLYKGKEFNHGWGGTH